MCGIVGAILQRNVCPILMEGLTRMEYRGYDSAGLAIINEAGQVERLRTQGKVKVLKDTLAQENLSSHMGMAHTRWATHGKPCEANAHPHISEGNETIAVVHNGIIENFQAIKKRLQKEGYTFTSETDSEVIAHLIHEKIEAGLRLREAISAAISELKGAYSIGVMVSSHPDRIIAARSGSPLVIGLGFDENYFASDYLALLPVTQRFVYLEEGDMAEITKDNVEIFDAQGVLVQRAVKTASPDLYVSADRGEYRHFMQKEIFEQPDAIRATLEGRLSEEHVLDAAFGTHAEAIFDQVKNLHFVACGTSYNAAQVAAYWIEREAGLPCRVEIASEYRYRPALVPEDTLLVVISQSGETADTLAALQHAKKVNYLTSLAICNVPESAIVREADLVLLTRAGPEIGVASTKAFTTQLTALMLLNTVLARRHGFSAKQEKQRVDDLRKLPQLLTDALSLNAQIETLAKSFVDKNHSLFIGRGEYFPIVQEGALKLKEISYIHAEAYPAGELKHGPLALVDNNMPVIAVAPNDALFNKMMSNLEEVRVRGGNLIILTDTDILMPNEVVLKLNTTGIDHALMPLIYTIPLQLLSYHVALIKGTDVDQPRNLAKSVTVE